MSSFRMMGSSLYNSHHHLIAKARGESIFDANNQRVGIMRGNDLFDATNRKMMSVNGSQIFDGADKPVASMVDVNKAIDGAAGSVIVAALWFCFVR